MAFVRRSELGRDGVWPASAPVLLLDTLGELAGLYEGARAAFVGGTLVPVGGHNVLEPAAAAVPVLFGPHTEHVRDAATADEEFDKHLEMRDMNGWERRWLPRLGTGGYALYQAPLLPWQSSSPVNCTVQ